MPKPFHELTLDEFKDLVSQFPFTRRIESVHMHHTWRPNHTDFAKRPGLATIEAIFNFHTQVNHWSDIAQHVTIDPNGKIWTGRDWNVPPASSTGFNGNSAAGPFMFETIGDFDTGQDPFDGAQKQSVIGVINAVLTRFGLPVESVRFHNQMSPKSCPGTGINRDKFLKEVQAATSAAAAPRALTAFGEAESATRLRSLKIIAGWPTPASTSSAETFALDAEAAETAMNANEVAIITGELSAAAVASRSIFGGGPEFSPEEKQALRPHVIDLRLGLLSDGGTFQTSIGDVQRIFHELLPAELELRKREGQPLRLVFYAHGGLVSEEDGIRPILRRLPFWRQNGLYPIFFCWETGFEETVADILKTSSKAARGLVSDFNDAVLESIAAAPGAKVWGQMKRSAELASMPGGGARLVAEMTRDFWTAHHSEMEIHAVGHSAGSIFHAFFLPTLLDQKTESGATALSVKSLHFLAPACTMALFEERLLPRIGEKRQILSHTMYTMNKDFEQADVAGPYRKSLLYFVSRSFEHQRPTPILGLEESLRADPSLVGFYGLGPNGPGVAKVLFSKTSPNAALDSATEAIKHGDFDNEAKTMNSVARRILGKSTGNIVGFVDEVARNEVSRALAFTPVPLSVPAAVVSVAGASRQLTPQIARALCIGIDAYPAPNALSGCVNDARDWAQALTALNCDVTLLVNQQATREAILGGIRQLISTSNAGDVIVIQYAGHGTQVKDLDGDETDGQDEALVPIDFESGSFLIDDDLRSVMLTIPPGVNVTCFMDCCHSGTNTRFLGPTPVSRVGASKARFLKMTPELDQAHIAFRSQMREGPAPPPRTCDGMLEVNFSACRPEQVALETDGSGDFTRRAVPILRAGIDGVTNEVFLKRVLDAFGAAARQEPTLDCAEAAASRPLLGSLIAGGTPMAAAAPASPIAASDNFAARLEDVERRLRKLGV